MEQSIFYEENKKVLLFDLIKYFNKRKKNNEDVYQCFSKNPYVSLDYLKRNKDENWNWGYNGLSSNPSVEIEWFETFPDKPWDINALLENKNFDLKWIRYLSGLPRQPQYQNIDWNWLLEEKEDDCDFIDEELLEIIYNNESYQTETFEGIVDKITLNSIN